ncbi:CaiB/BaiF CoA transferase family protein [Paraburkholderia caribensis]|uniref:CaiB/BaiF CoA transferase family protein n=1 Tax=Paraburkholderia caribensis TaxID=75105 RepID=UPI001CB12796|nr:CaiB/BaiF CoA-transferase family protein [Paraburkholderia caribensis]CAG9249580.1 Formyl-CoA transferase [Paraburkholderia caribensis]
MVNNVTSTRKLPLAGVKIVDFTQVQFGPMATQILADFGADVIKVERPGLGDISRSIDVKADGVEDSSSFLAFNRNKRSLVLDMKREGALEIVHRLLEDADVLVANFRAGVAQRLGLGYDDLKDRYPRLIYASGTGFGESGPLAELGGQDMVLQSMSGTLWHHRDEAGRPRIYPTSFIDFGAGMAITQGILLALIERGVSGKGQRVDVSMIDTAVFFQAQEYTGWMMRRFELHWERDNLVGVFRTSDGWVTVVGLFRPDPLRAVCDALGIDGVAEQAEFASQSLIIENRAHLWGILEAHFSRYRTEEVVARLAQANVLCGPVFNYDDVIAHPQIMENQTFRELTHPKVGNVKVVDTPIRLSASRDAQVFNAPPLLGQHTSEVLNWLGYSDEEIDAMRESGLID